MCDWATWGTIGDTFGGLANVGTLISVVVGGWWARNEVRRARAHHRYQARADACAAALRALSGFVGSIEGTRSILLLPQAQSQQLVQLTLDRLVGYLFSFLDASSHASLYFDPPMVEVFDSAIRRVEVASRVVLNRSAPEAELAAARTEAREVLNLLRAELLPFVRADDD